jgi:hypothetical protein
MKQLLTPFLFAASVELSVLAHPNRLQVKLHGLASESDGRVGVCALPFGKARPVCVRATNCFLFNAWSEKVGDRVAMAHHFLPIPA